ncbi:5'-nucleotidase C-terminal domain-containing protein [Rossellomorea aquimaris]|uniref:bifunctional metallophosphatase/5'-nucleotidase n=1 Tax=Rossellomorea aquimaris TaxID=189382 RepID=UPI001CD4C2A7|nr:5'-nucleotidase C-terminal domain-containing protein [Rossellomorea aquimaris]MCA1055644.1 5'-nucleotidase C-terminal domain-containing protein [Rossellomorea aquimaris]
MKLNIIHTNDLHSHFDAFSRAVSIIKEYGDEDTLILDGGDFADFKSIELQGTRGMAAIELLEYAGYAALTIGNNEMFNGVDTLEYMASNSGVPFISNNLLKRDRTRIDGVCSSTILEKKGLRILITGASPDMQDFSDGLGVHMTDYKSAIMKELEIQQGNYDLCILLNHLGTFVDDELVGELKGVDIILSAHDHKLYPHSKVVNNTIMNSAGCYGEYVGVIEIDVNEDGIELLHSQNIGTKDAQRDEGVLSILAKNKEKAIEVLSEPLYSIEEPLWHDVVEENPLTNLIADGVKDMLGCEIGLMNGGIANAGVFGYISNKKLIEVCPSPLNPTSFEIQGKYIREAFEQSLDAGVCLNEGRGPGFRGRFVGSLHVSGAEVVHDGKRVLEVLIGGELLDEDRWYKAASSDYLQRGSGYPSLANNRNENYLAEEIKDVIRIYARRSDSVKQAAVNRWKVRADVII